MSPKLHTDLKAELWKVFTELVADNPLLFSKSTNFSMLKIYHYLICTVKVWKSIWFLFHKEQKLIMWRGLENDQPINKLLKDLGEMQTNWLIGWLTGGLNTDWLHGWPTDLLTDELTDWLMDWTLTDQLTGRLTDWLTDWLTGRQTTCSWLADWLTDELKTDWLTDLLNNLLAHWFTDSPRHWWTDLLTDWSTYWLTDKLHTFKTAFVPIIQYNVGEVLSKGSVSS